MPTTKATFEQYTKISRGINVFARDTMLTEEESVIGLNVWGVGKQSIRKRPGTKLLATISAVSKVDGIASYVTNSVRELLALAGGTLYKVQTGTPTSISGKTYTSGLRTDFCQAGGKVFIQNGTDNLSEYAGSTIADTTNGQKGKWLIYYKSSLWTAGLSTDNTRLYRSGTDTKLGDFTYNVSTNPLATSVFVGKDDGQAITGFFKHQDYLYVVKERSLWRVTQAADASGTISLELIDPARGADSHFTIDSVENDVFFLNEKGIFSMGYEPNILDQIRTNVISLRVDPKLKAIQKSRLDDTCAIYSDNHYYLSYTSGGGTYNDTILCYDRQRLGFWEWPISANCFSEFKNSDGYTYLYYGSSTDGKIYYFDETTKTDNGVAFSSAWRSPNYSLTGNLNQQKFINHVVLYFGRMRGQVTLNVYVDGTLHKTETITLGAGESGALGTQTLGTEILGVGGDSSTSSSDRFKVAINKMGSNVALEIIDSQLYSWELNAIEFAFVPITRFYIKT